MSHRTQALAILLLALCASGYPVLAEDTIVHFTIDATANTRPISRYIYGVNRKIDGEWAGATLSRVGGNRLTAYNWTNNASNAGSDWQFQNDNYLGNTDTPGAVYASAIENTSDARAGVVITVPAKGAPFTLTPDPASRIVYQDEMVNWIKTKYPHVLTDPARPIFFNLDNEPDLWQSTHLEVHPEPVTYAELVDKSTQYAKAIKAVMPKAKIFGAVNYGWQGYVRLQNAPDANGRDFQEFFLAEMKAAEKSAGRRLIDALDFHWYPEAQGGGKRIVVPDSEPPVAEARMQAPRSLWDPTYTESSWIARDVLHAPIALLPRIQKKIADNYPGTLMAITEYNYGGGGHISGAIAQADVLGIFGQQGVFAAAEWPMAKDESFIAAGMKMFRNFDGKGGAFGDTAVQSTTDNIAATSVYASTDSANRKRMVIVAINKTARAAEVEIAISHGRPSKTARVFELSGDQPAPRPGGPLVITTPGKIHYEFPAYSVNAIELVE